jgi:hypothetical protein
VRREAARNQDTCPVKCEREIAAQSTAVARLIKKLLSEEELSLRQRIMPQSNRAAGERCRFFAAKNGALFAS